MLMDDNKLDIIEETIKFWSKKNIQEKVFSHEDARQSIENISGFIEILQKWQGSKKIPESKMEKNSIE